MELFRKLYLNRKLFHWLLALLALFVLSFVFTGWFAVTQFALFGVLALLLLDVFMLFSGNRKILANRKLTEKFSNGDENPVTLSVSNRYAFPIHIKVIDEIPVQFQVRDFMLQKSISAKSEITLEYSLRPTERGEYHFGKLNIYVSSPLGLASRRYVFDENQMVPTYPSYLQLRNFELFAFSNQLQQFGVKRIRRIGHTMEFEQIKEYVSGDDIRTLNWKASAKKNAMMVNQFQDEKSQSVYMAIDKGRVMKMPFNGLSLLDYALNSALVLSAVILKKQDRPGIFAFSKKVTNRVAAEKRAAQMSKILESLYNVSTDYFESDYSRLYADIRKNIPHRSLIILYTNFETLDGMQRQLRYLKGIAKHHLLLVVFFRNTELDGLIQQPAQTIHQVYDKIAAEKFLFEKRLVVNELRKFGIHTLFTRPETLTADAINKYLEIKSRGIL